MRFNRRHILLVFVALAIVTLFLPIPVRYSFIATARIYPWKEWKLARGVDEGFWSQSYDFETDAAGDFLNYRFERGDIAELRIKEGMAFDTMIRALDTVAYIQSFYIDNEITRLSNLRDIEIATKEVVSSGEKSSLIEQARKEYDYALQQLDFEKKNFIRQEILYNDSVIPQAEFDVAQSSYTLAEIYTQVAYNALAALETGEKDPVLNLTEQKIKSYDKEITRLESQKRQYTITTPLAGWLTYDPLQDGIIKVNDISRLVLKIPVPYQQITYLNRLHSVKFSTPDNKIKVSAAYKGYGETISLINSQQYVIAKAVTNEMIQGIYPGMVVECRIYCDRVILLEYIKRNFSVVF